MAAQAEDETASPPFLLAVYDHKASTTLTNVIRPLRVGWSQPPPKIARPLTASGKGQFLVYEAEHGRVKIDVRLADETVWLPQALIADLFQTLVPNISMHIRNVYEKGELHPRGNH